MNNFVALLNFSCYLSFVINLFIGGFVYSKNRKNSINTFFCLFSVTIAFWSVGSSLVNSISNKYIALLVLRFCYLFAVILPPIYLHFIYFITGQKRNKTSIIPISYLLSLGLLFFLFSNLFIKGIRIIEPYGVLISNPGPAYYVFILFFGFGTYLGLSTLYTSIKESTGARRNQLKYMFISQLVALSAGYEYFSSVLGIKRFPPLDDYILVVYFAIMAYAILKYRLMDINIALTRAGIFIFVYLFVLGIPFVLGYRYELWQLATWITVILASGGPFIFIFLRRRAEAGIQAEERRGRELLKQASEGMMRIRSIKRLVSLMVHVTCKILKLDNAAVFLLDEEERQYKLEAVRLRSKYGCREYLQQDDVLIQRLSALEEPLVYEEIKTQAQNIKDKSSELIREISSQMESLSATLIIPASSRGRLLGFLALGEKKSKRMYSHEDLSVLWVVSNQAALAIENAQFHKKAQEALLQEDREMTARFIGHGASHQFGNVLNRIIQRSSGREMDIAELDLNTLSPDELKNMLWQFREDFHAITNAGMQGKEIVSGILSLGAGSTVDFKQEDLKAIIQHMDAALPEILADIPDTLPKAWCNSLQIEQVLENMLDNALEAIEEKESLIKHGEFSNDEVFRGKVLIKAGTDAERISLEILDNGIGIKQGDLKNMFTPFFTTKATERLSRKGHGIGMHMVKEILRAHQGKIYLAGTEFGKGTTFRIEFPLEIAESKKL